MPYLSRRELAAELNVSPKTLRRLERLGIGPKPIRVSERIARYAPGAATEFKALDFSAPAEIEASHA